MKLSRIIAIILIVILVVSCSNNTKNTTTTSTINKTSNNTNPRTIKGPTTAKTVADVKPISPAPTPQLPTTFVDERGKSITVTNVDRIIALDIYGTLAQSVVGLGLGKNLVGRGQTSTSQALASLPVVTQNGIVMDAEAILKLKPTILLVDSSLGPESVPDQVEKSGITVVHLSEKRNMSNISERIQKVADALGVSDAGKELSSRIEKELKAAKSEISELAPKYKMRMAFVYLRGSTGYYFIFGEGEGADDLIVALDGIDVASNQGIKGAAPVQPEMLAVMDPEVILTMTKGFNEAGGADALVKRPGIADTTAGKNMRFIDMDDGQILSFGPNIADVLVSLAKAIYKQET